MERGFSPTEIASSAKIAKDRPKLKIKTFETRRNRRRGGM